MAGEEEEMMIEEEKEMQTTTTPQEIIMEILSRIPAKFLISSFKLVCKPWHNLIQDPVFIKMHLNQVAIHGGGGGSRSNNNSSLICKSGENLFQLHPPFNFEGIPSSTIQAPTKIDFDALLRNSRLVGSCNGLLCICFSNDETILLLNPSTRKFKLSPKQRIQCPPNLVTYGSATYGFDCCYNSITNIDEYKVIRIVIFSNIDDNILFSSRYQFDIYSMSSNSWRRETKIIRDYPYVISTQQSGIVINGALHWVARYAPQTVSISADSWDTIVSFDIKDEEFRQVPIPPSCYPTADDPYRMNAVILMNMKGCLSMIRFPDGINNSMDAADLEIWVMKEYGIKESWTKEFVIRTSDFVISPRSNAHVLKGDQILIQGRTYINEGSQFSSLAEGCKKWVLYDINERKIDGDFKMIGVPDDFKMTGVPNDSYFDKVDQVDYIETLVSLKSSVLPSSNNRKIMDMESIRSQQYRDIRDLFSKVYS